MRWLVGMPSSRGTAQALTPHQSLRDLCAELHGEEDVLVLS